MENSYIINSKDFSSYGKEFQMKFLSLLLKDRPFSANIIPIVKDVYFSDVYLRTVFVTISKYYKEYYVTPSIDNLRIELLKESKSAKLYDVLLKSIDEVGLEDRDFVINNSKDFCFTKHALIEQEKITLAIKEGRFSDARRLSLEMYQFGVVESARVFNLKEDYKKIYESNLLRAPVASVFKTFTDNSKGGLGSGDLCIIVAPSNFGKSNFAAALARDANVNKKNVLYFSYEETAEAVAEKYLAGLVDEERSKLNFAKRNIELSVEDLPSNLVVIEDKGSKATLSNIKSQIQYVKTLNFFPELVIVDGLNQLKLPKGLKVSGDNEKYEILTEELKELLKEERLPGYATWQMNRLGFTSDLGGIETIGKAIEVFQKADQVITFSQPPHLKDKMECVANLLKNRLGKKEIPLRVYYDPAKALFVERGILDPTVLMSDSQKEKVKSSISSTREKLKML